MPPFTGGYCLFCATLVFSSRANTPVQTGADRAAWKNAAVYRRLLLILRYPGFFQPGEYSGANGRGS
ncbi:hypothetical protein CKF46_37840, partial [Klebsiella pneumoniae]